MARVCLPLFPNHLQLLIGGRGFALSTTVSQGAAFCAGQAADRGRGRHEFDDSKHAFGRTRASAPTAGCEEPVPHHSRRARIDQRGKALALFATRAIVLDHFRESQVAPVRNATVHAADWPGPDVSSGQGQTSRREEGAVGSTDLGSFAASDSIQSSTPALRTRVRSWYGRCYLVRREQFASLECSKSSPTRVGDIAGLPRGRFRCNSTDPRMESSNEESVRSFRS